MRSVRAWPLSLRSDRHPSIESLDLELVLLVGLLSTEARQSNDECDDATARRATTGSERHEGNSSFGNQFFNEPRFDVHCVNVDDRHVDAGIVGNGQHFSLLTAVLSPLSSS